MLKYQGPNKEESIKGSLQAFQGKKHLCLDLNDQQDNVCKACGGRLFLDERRACSSEVRKWRGALRF